MLDIVIHLEATGEPLIPTQQEDQRCSRDVLEYEDAKQTEQSRAFERLRALEDELGIND